MGSDWSTPARRNQGHKASERDDRAPNEERLDSNDLGDRAGIVEHETSPCHRQRTMPLGSDVLERCDDIDPARFHVGGPCVVQEIRDRGFEAAHIVERTPGDLGRVTAGKRELGLQRDPQRSERCAQLVRRIGAEGSFAADQMIETERVE